MEDTPARLAPPSARQLLGRILDAPELVGAVQALEPRALGRLIDHLGLEDSGELVALATTAQLEAIFDDDLWRSPRPGQDETFDAERFAVWLEVMLEAGEDFTARKLAELPEDLVTLALERHLIVINIDELAVEMSERSDEHDLTEKALESCLYHELGEYRLIARRHDGWDAIVAVLTALDQEHHDFLWRVLERLCYASSAAIEDHGGLYDVLTSAEMLESDVHADREDRRARQGFVAPSAAASFLRLARATDLAQLESQATDPVTRAYFREYQPAPPPARARAPGTGAATPAGPPAEVAKLLTLLREAEVLPAAPVPLLDRGAPRGPTEGDDLFREALHTLREADPELHAQRMLELTYLANVLVAGCSLDGRTFRPLEAARAALATCALGLEHLTSRARLTPAEVLLRDAAHKLFRVGWHLLHRGVASPPSAAPTAPPGLEAALGARGGPSPRVR